jgi:hypothetical protein
MLAVLSWMVAWSSTNCSKTQTTDAAGGGEFSGKAAILAPMASSAEPLLRISDFDENPFGYDLTASPHMTRIEAACCALPAFVSAHPDKQQDAQ